MTEFDCTEITEDSTGVVRPTNLLRHVSYTNENCVETFTERYLKDQFKFNFHCLHELKFIVNQVRMKTLNWMYSNRVHQFHQ